MLSIGQLLLVLLISFFPSITLSTHPLCDFAQNTNMSAINRALNNRFYGWRCTTGEEKEEDICRQWTNIECQFGKVVSIGLSDAGFNGTIPSSVGQLKSLRRLDLDGNNFHGTIPTSIASLTLLQRLTLMNNALTGPIPSLFGKLVNLQSLYMAHNNLTGTLPSELANLKRLDFLTLGHNSITGTIPEEYGSSFVECTMELNDNQLVGVIPLNLCNSYQLYTYGNEGLINNCEGFCLENGECDSVGIVNDKFAGIDMEAPEDPVISFG